MGAIMPLGWDISRWSRPGVRPFHGAHGGNYADPEFAPGEAAEFNE